MFDDLRPHLAELRKRLGLSVLSVFVAFIIAFTFHNAILTWITAPLNNALTQVGRIIESQEKATWTMKQEENTSKTPAVKAAEKLQRNLYEAAKAADPKLAPLLKNAADAARVLDDTIKKRDHNSARPNQHNFEGKITTHQVGGAFFVALKVSFFAGLLGAMPFILYQLWLFVAPGLYSNEKKMVIPFVVGGSLMFFIGVVFAYYVVTPFGFQFLITFGSFLYTPFINIEDYVGFFTKIMLGFGIAFELPVFAYFLALLGLVTDRTLIDFFKYAIVIIFVLAAILTPPDILTQLLMAAPLVLLYVLSIFIVRMVNPEKKDDEEEENDAETYENESTQNTLPDELDKP
ncbi:Twin-arginine translocation protein TatC [hydrothermal vent metagenome]|uniref:Twin-arginine translocation protein TatC n=1 Tax=hydrothermal vent metagenome TaxID=652676 RepID=A0A1W1BZU6_9ZZZZ